MLPLAPGGAGGWIEFASGGFHAKLAGSGKLER